MKRRDKHQWMLDRINDPYFKRAKKEGYRARSAYKLIEIHQKFNIVPKVGKILDLGCAPGAWLQVLKKISNCTLYGIDLINIDNLDSVFFFKSDIFSSEIDNFLKNLQFDLILSDLAPNCCGIKEQDHLCIMNFADRVFYLVLSHLKFGANFCIKLFDGRETVEYVNMAKNSFKKVKFFKPKSSSRESNEFYLICLDFFKSNYDF